MEDPRLEEILNRLDAMERALDELRDGRARDDRRLREGHRGHGCRCHERGRHEHGCGERRERGCDCRRDSEGPAGGQAFHEKRVVDLIVRLVAERVDELLWRHLRERQGAVASQEQAHDEGEGTTEA